MPAKHFLQQMLEKLRLIIRSESHEFGFQSYAPEPDEESDRKGDWSEECPACGMPLKSTLTRQEILTHNPYTCRLVNLVLMEMGVVLGQQIRVEIYPMSGPLRGFYATSDPCTIHISHEAYSQFPEYIIFHETKHLVDCLTKGWSEEETPDEFARSLCIKYGYGWSPHYQPGDFITLNRMRTERNIWF